MMQDTISQRNAAHPLLRETPYEECQNLPEFLARHLEGTDYQFARSCFQIRDEGGIGHAC